LLYYLVWGSPSPSLPLESRPRMLVSSKYIARRF
ncbi:MAG: hypothetical protein ACJAT7_003864, partial [Psychromonas sp.]